MHLVWKHASSITTPGMFVCQTYSWIWTLHELKGITVKSWQNIPIRCFSFWMNGYFSNQLIQNRKISLNFFIGDARNHQPSSVLSMYLKNGMISLVVKQVLQLMPSLTVLHTIVIRSISQALMLIMIGPCGRCMVQINHYESNTLIKVAHSVWIGGLRHTGRAALPHENIQKLPFLSRETSIVISPAVVLMFFAVPISTVWSILFSTLIITIA